MLIYRDKLLIATSDLGIKAGKVRNGRNNLILLSGEGEDLSKYQEISRFVDPLGIVYYDIINSGDDLYMLWSNSSRFPDYVKWGAVQGKDLILFRKIEL